MSLPATQSDLNILHLEDNPMDRAIVAKTLAAEKIGCHLLSCETRPQFEQALARGGFQVILADYQLPGFDGRQALELARKECPDVPFVFLSGVLGEEEAIESLKAGATDYVLKQRLERLAPAVRRAVREVAEREQCRAAEAAQRRTEARFHVFMNNLPGLAFIKDARGRWVWLNRRWDDVLGRPAGQLVGTETLDFYPEAVAARAREIEAQVFQSGMPADSMEEFGAPEGGSRVWLVTRFVIEQPGEKPLLGGVALDITGRVRTERQLAAERARLQELVDHNLALLADQEIRLS